MFRYRMGTQSIRKTSPYIGSETSEMLPFRLENYGEFISDSSYFTERQGVDKCLLFATISGCGFLRYAGQEELLSAGKAAVIDCSRYQYYGTFGKEPWHFSWIHFKGTGADSFVRMINREGLRIINWDASRAADLYSQADELARTPGKQADFLISLWLHQILNEFAQAVEGAAAVRYEQEMLAAAEFLREHLQEPVRMTDLARQSGLSEYHFIRVFKSVIGHPPYEYLTLLRVAHAKQLLLSTSMSVSEIAAQTGYSDSRGLIDNFRHHTGKTPAGFRKQAREGILLP